MRPLTQWMVERHTEFGTLDRYFDGYSIAGDRLSALQVPASILMAQDDPVIPVEGFHALAAAALGAAWRSRPGAATAASSRAPAWMASPSAGSRSGCWTWRNNSALLWERLQPRPGHCHGSRG